MLKKLRAGLMNALLWSFGGAVWGAVTAMVVTVVVGAPPGSLFAFFKMAALQFAQLGFVSGAVFSVAFGLVYRNADFDALRMWRVAGLGAAAGSVIPVGLAIASVTSGVAVPLLSFASFTGFCALFGGGSAAGLLKVAQAAPVGSGRVERGYISDTDRALVDGGRVDA
ncbi:MAG: hypothetical protein AAF389_10145 [Gemmatimonadota bacterium]